MPGMCRPPPVEVLAQGDHQGSTRLLFTGAAHPLAVALIIPLIMVPLLPFTCFGHYCVVTPQIRDWPLCHLSRFAITLPVAGVFSPSLSLK